MSLLSLAFILALHQPYHGGGPINTPTHTLYSLAVTDWYTPEARRELFRVPILIIESPFAICQYMNDARSDFIPAIGCRISYWVSHNFDPYQARQSLMHEFNHIEDFACGLCYSSDPEFVSVSLTLDNQYPAINPDWRLSEQNPVERYAYIGIVPWLFPELREFYPQFSPKAFLPR